MNDQEMRLAREYRPTMDGEVLAAWAKDAASALARMSARCEDAAREIDKAVSVLDAADRVPAGAADGVRLGLLAFGDLGRALDAEHVAARQQAGGAQAEGQGKVSHGAWTGFV